MSLHSTPIELVKCKMQVQMLVTGPAPSLTGAPTTPLPGPLAVLKTIVRETGVRGLWLGHLGTLIREAGGCAAWFSSKEYVAGLLLARRGSGGAGQGRDLVAWESALAGACAGAAYNVSFFPADTIKSTMQTEGELRPSAPGAPKATFLGTGMNLWRKQGIRGLYAGMGVTAARSIPSSAIIFLIYDGLNQHFA